MTKTELIEALSNEAGLTTSNAKEVAKTVFNAMANALADGDRVEIRGFGTFKVKNYDGYTGTTLRQAHLSRSSPRSCRSSNAAGS